ncbi:MAG: hypothetical protein ABSB00_02010 [Minisyncoccia bacterium]|jgi:hypothetical protein
MNNHILPTLALLIAIGIFFTYVNPTWSGPIATAKAAIASDGQALAAASQYAAQQNELASARNAIAPADIARLTTFLPDSVNNVGLILDLNALAARSGISLSNVNITVNANNAGAASSATGALPVSGASPVGSADFSLSAKGTYTAFLAFLAGIEKSERLLDVRDITVEGSDTGVYTYQMTLRLYWLQ